MRNIKAIFCDIDGTLLDHSEGKSVFPDSARRALSAAQRRGVKVFVATGRYPGILWDIRDLFPFDGFVTMNGQFVLLQDGIVIHKAAHDPEDIRGLLPLVHKAGFAVQIIEEEATFPVDGSNQKVATMYHWAGEPVPPDYDVSRLDEHPVLQFVAFLPLEEAKQALAPLKHIEVTSAGGNLSDILPQGGGKEIGIAAAAEHFGIRREEIMTVGDGVNDVRMLRWAGVGVAMGNAAQEAKDAADHVTTPVWDGGIQNALLHFGVIEQGDLEREIDEE